jgi:peptidoglycan/LPS O-acetylase OafA/YrhL
MPEPVRSGQRYLPGLDGLRALAVLAVIAFHEQLGWAPGGLLGVGVFFTLSGYLITDLLLGRWSEDGRLHLGDFWLRRARRLLPAVFAMLAVVTAWVTVMDRSQLAGLRPAVAAAAGYVSNWYFIIQNNSYFARFGPPSPLNHLWSLAVEEQFYLAWPWLLLLGVWVLRNRREGGTRWLALPTLALGAGSALAMTALYHPGFDPTRVYEGTDTRAFGLLAGAALAMVWPSRGRSRPPAAARAALDAAGFGGLAVIALLVWRVGQYSPFAYRGGLVILSVATVGVLAAVACPGSLLGRVLGVAPLRWLGVRSYGIYLWHFPVIVLTSPPNSAEDLPRAAAQVTASILLAALSWRYLEEPVRRGALGRVWRQLRTSGLRARAAGPQAWAAVVAGTGVLVVACAGLSGTVPATGSGPQAAGTHPVGGLAAGGKGKAAAQAGAAVSPAGSGTPAGPLRTSCTAVAHIGDSTSDGLDSPDYLPDPKLRIRAQYEDVGVRHVYLDISGARSVVETLPGQINGYDAARNLVRRGFRGCWVIALGTDDTADVVVGSNVSRMARIERMMSVAHGEPVLWVNVKTLVPSGPYAESSMQQWNATLERACPKYPNMRIYDWASVARRSWFINDGVHYTSAGYAARSRLIAQALAKAFPAGGTSHSCTVS